MAENVVTRGSSPYSTGSGGVVLEHEYAAAALASVLLAEPVVGLGEEFTARRVGLQQERYSPVDDVLVLGESNGRERKLLVACRRRPIIGPSDESTVKLFADFIAVVLSERADLERGTLRLGLAVAGPFGPAAELEVLADVARRQPDRTSFDEAVLAPGAYSAKVRRRLKNVDDLVAKALRLAAGQRATEDPNDVTWELLRSLYIVQTQFEGDAAPGRIDLVARLQTLTGTPEAANKLRLKLVETASEGAIRAGLFNRAMLRRELVGIGELGASRDFAAAKKQVEILEAELRRRTQHFLPVLGSDSPFALERTELRSKLNETISSLPSGGIVIVHGEPGVGKSALALGVAESIRASGGTLLAMSLRDIPSKPVEFGSTIGLAPDDLLSAAPSSDLSVLLLDGAEVLQETGSGAAGLLLEACQATGRRTVLVSRDDALGAVRELVRASGVREAIEFPVPALTDSEITEVTRAVPGLHRLASDNRSRWLLRRLGLIKLLLHSAEKGAELPSSLASEADVFRVVWSSLVRQNEKRIASVSADDREAAALEVAEHLLRGRSQVSGGSAFATLRSDGLLLPRGPTAPWQRGDAFSSDVLRDFAVARLLLSHGLDVLAESAAPRWAVRAARIYAQGRMADVLGRDPAAKARRWAEVRDDFAQLASEHGARWAEVPWEALLTAGWAESVLDALEPEFAEELETLREAISCVNLRFSEAGACDPVIAAPLVRLVIKAGGIQGPRSYGDEPLLNFVASWLRGVARREAAGADLSDLKPLRAHVRDALLDRPPERGEGERLECLGLLGSDATLGSREILQQMASTAPAFLAPTVESLDVAVSLARHDVALLAELTEAYYVEEPMEQYLRSHLTDNGIRDHRGGGMFTPLAAWYRGPFLPLLRADWQLGLGVIDRMLDRGARAQAGILDSLAERSDNGAPTGQEEIGLSLDLFGYGPRLYLGDAHVWSWYRGSSVGPYPCMSALFSLEMILDEYVQAGVALRPLVRSLLRNATTLATPGLAYGFLVRHIDRVRDELDDFLAIPEVWHLEFGRIVSEGRLHVQGPDPADRIGRERRGWTPREVASRLVIQAAQRDDTGALDRLRKVGRELVDRAGGKVAPPEVLQWAAHLDWDSYEMEADGDRIVIQVRPPEEAVEALAPAQARSERVLQLYGLQSRYRLEQVTPYRFAVASPSADRDVIEEVVSARQLASQLPDQPLDQVRMTLAGLAATVVARDFEGMRPDDYCWALGVLIDSALHPYMDDFPIESAIFLDGADRKAALALPRALLWADRCEGVDTAEIIAAMKAGAASEFVEVRESAAEGCRQVFNDGCRTVLDGRCWHEVAWDAVEHGARHVRLGPAYVHGRRQIESITGDLAKELEHTSTGDLMLTHIAPAAAAAIYAARDGLCVHEKAAPLRDTLINAYVRTAIHWAEEDYDFRKEKWGAFASAVLGWAAVEGGHVLLNLARRFKESPDALGNFLNAMTLVATYEPSAVPLLQEVWPRVMRLGLGVLRENDVRARHAEENLVQNLIPDPTASTYIADFDSVMKAARANWLKLDSVSPHMDEWLSVAKEHRWCVDALVAFLQAQPEPDQLQPGLSWVRSLIIDDEGHAETSGFLLIPWLTDLRSTSSLRGSALADYRALVDGLAIAGYSGATALQQRDE